MVINAGHLAAQLPKLDSGDLDDASSATETASIADSDAPLEATLCSAGENPIAPQTADSEHSHVTPEHCQIWRSFRTPGTAPAALQMMLPVVPAEGPISVPLGLGPYVERAILPGPRPLSICRTASWASPLRLFREAVQGMNPMLVS